MKNIVRYLGAAVSVAIVLSALSAGTLRAQDNPVPCKAAACVLVIDWGSGKTSGSYPVDRRYGSGDDFEVRFRAAMGARGYTLRDMAGEGAMTVTVRPTFKARVMCDAVPGLNPDMSCTALTDLAVTFLTGDKAAKAPGAMRISNRCGAGNIYMLNRVFALYAADMIWYQLEGQAAKADKPMSSTC